MTTPNSTPATDTSKDVSTGSTTTDLVTTHGSTTIADTVVEKIAGLAAREVNGVYNLGGAASRAFGAVRERIPGARRSLGQGVSVEVGERQAAVDLDLIVEYGVPIGDLSKAIRRNVITSIERMTALEVTEVNIAVTNVHIPGDDDDNDDDDKASEQKPARVQ